MKRFLLLILFANILTNITFAQPDKAKRYYDEAKTLYYLYHNGNNDKINLIKALAKINKAIQIYPEYKNAYQVQSMIYVSMDSCSKALNSINKFIQFDSTYAKGYSYRSYVFYYCNDDVLSSYNDLDKVLKLDPNCVEALIERAQQRSRLFNDGIIIVSDSMKNQILKDYQRAIELEPENVDAYYARAGYKQMILKDIEGACKDWEKLKELGQDVDYELYNYCKWDGR